jgi:hypothetical protein
VAVGASSSVTGQVRDRFAFELAKVRLAMVGEDLRDWFSSARDNHGVDVHEFPSEAACNQWTGRAFPGGHESS